MKPKLISITYGYGGDIYALDEEGNVWTKAGGLVRAYYWELFMSKEAEFKL